MTALVASLGFNDALQSRLAAPLDLGLKVMFQEQRRRGRKIYALHAPEVECIGNGKARSPYEFGCKVSVATPVTQPRGGQFVLHAQALHGNPFDGHTLGAVIADLERLTGVEVNRIHVDKGYRGHTYPNTFRVWISGQVRNVTATIRREMKPRAVHRRTRPLIPTPKGPSILRRMSRMRRPAWCAELERPARPLELVGVDITPDHDMAVRLATRR